jgi:hypothetical protein
MAHCRQCRYCEDEPGAFERLVPGLNTLSSGYGESKGDTALCVHHNMFMLPGPGCGDFQPRMEAPRCAEAVVVR